MNTYITIVKFLIQNDYVFSDNEKNKQLENKCNNVYNLLDLCNYINNKYSKVNIKELDIIEIIKDLNVCGFEINGNIYYPIDYFNFDGSYISIIFNSKLLKMYLWEFFNEK
jgi:hypothetical protein